MCGHSDCKAMRFLLSLRDDPAMFSLDVGARQHLPKHCNTPLRSEISCYLIPPQLTMSEPGL